MSKVKAPERFVIDLESPILDEKGFATTAKWASKYKDEDHRRAWRAHLGAEAERKQQAGISAARDTEAKRASKQHGAILRSTELPKINPESREIVADQAPMMKDFDPRWLKVHDPRIFLDSIFEADDLVELDSNTGMPVVRRYKTVDLGLHRRIVPSPVDSKARRFVVIRSQPGIATNLNAQWRRLTYLSKSAPFVLAVLDLAADRIEGWFSVRHFSNQQIKKFFTRACEVGGDFKTGFSGFLAKIPAATLTLQRDPFPSLNEAGLFKTPEEMVKACGGTTRRNLVLRFNKPPK